LQNPPWKQPLRVARKNRRSERSLYLNNVKMLQISRRKGRKMKIQIWLQRRARLRREAHLLKNKKKGTKVIKCPLFRGSPFGWLSCHENENISCARSSGSCDTIRWKCALSGTWSQAAVLLVLVPIYSCRTYVATL
jgi:hypothetical protein